MGHPSRRIAIAGIVHETNTYCRDETRADAFHQMRGEQIFRSKDTETNLGGALAACERLGYECLPILVASAQPSGAINVDDYQSFKQEILEGISQLLPLDGVYLDLHGAGVVSGIDDLEGDLCASIRELLGESIPLTASFDLHGNISVKMVEALNGTFVCHHYPHVDMHHRAEEAIDLIQGMLDDGLKPYSCIESLPMLLPTTTTFEGIGEQTLAYMQDLEQQDGVIDVSWFHGFPYTDIPHVGSHIVVTSKNDPELARRIARQAAQYVWENREAFKPQSLSAEEALTKALSLGGAPVVINETSDNCGGGTPGDGTHLLKAMLDARLEKACFAFLVDPEVASQAHEAGIGANIDIELGGKYDDLHGKTLKLSAHVKALHNGRLTMKAMAKGAPLNIGNTARLVVDGLDIVVASNRSQTFDTGPFEAVGIDVMQYKIVALKSSNHFRAGFGDLAAAIVTADPPGLTTHHIEIFERENARQAMWPIDAAATYT